MKILMIIICFLSINSQAGIISTAMLASQNKQQSSQQIDIPNNTEDRMIQVLESNLSVKNIKEHELELFLKNPEILPKNIVNWHVYKDKTKKYNLKGLNSNYVFLYFLNKGYSVNLKNDELIFDFSIQHLYYLKWIESHNKTMNVLFIFLILTGALIISLFIMKYNKWKKRIIKAIDESKLVFCDINYEDQYNKIKKDKKFPQKWSFKLNEQGLIESISEVSHEGIKLIATSEIINQNSWKEYVLSIKEQ